MKKKRLAFLAFLIIAIALLLEAGILKHVNDKNTYRMSRVLLDRVVTVLNKNDENELQLIESLKDDYLYSKSKGCILYHRCKTTGRT